MPWDLPDEGGSKGPEEPAEGRKTDGVYVISSLEGGTDFVGTFDDKVDDKGRLNRFFKEIGRDGGSN